MRTFSTQTLMAVVTSAGIVLAFMRQPIFGIVLMVFILPIAMMLIGLTSPQRGNQLDPSQRWYLFVLAKAWAFTWVALLLFGLFCAAAPYYVRDRVFRTVSGDMRRHQLLIRFPGKRAVSDALAKKKLILYDKRGFVGEIRDVGCVESLQDGKKIDSYIWIRVSTDREDVLSRNSKRCQVEIRRDETLYVSD